MMHKENNHETTEQPDIRIQFQKPNGDGGIRKRQYTIYFQAQLAMGGRQNHAFQWNDFAVVSYETFV